MRFQYPDFEIISYQLGAVAAFAEMVATGMKKLAFSGIIEEKDLAVLEPGIKEITEKYHVSYHCQYNLIKSELAGDEQIKDRYVFLIYRDKEVLDEYFKLAEEEKKAEQEGSYDEAKRKEITIRLCRILSYPEKYIQNKFGGQENCRQ